MQKKTNTKARNQDYPYKKDVSTVNMYTGALRNYILPATRSLIQPCNTLWFLDCITPKEYTFEGKQTTFVKPQEPIYMRARIVKEALKISQDKGGDKGGQRGTILSAASKFMDFIELHFTDNLNLYGPEPLSKIILYHNSVRKVTTAKGVWRKLNNEKDYVQITNKLRKDYEYPNKDIDILRKYQIYKESPDRINKLKKTISLCKSPECPSTSEILEMERFLMGEVIAATGKRSIVVMGMSLGAWIARTPGFNQYNDSESKPNNDGMKEKNNFYNRVNPSLPPKEKACQHQLENNSADCPIMYENRCKPDGYNILIDHDKGQDSKKSSYMHIPIEITDLMELFDVKRTQYFSGRESPVTDNKDWLEDENMPFFLNANCTAFKFLDLSHLSEALGTDVTSYVHRKMISKWGPTHNSKEIRELEGESLQHDDKVAQKNYLLSKQVIPQKFTQTYIEEENIFPQSFTDQINKTSESIKQLIKEKERKRKEKQMERLIHENINYKNVLNENKKLGPRKRVLQSDTKHFMKLIGTITRSRNNCSIKEKTPKEWRNYIMRLVCSTKGPHGEELRNLWKKIYAGNLEWGVINARMAAKDNGWTVRDKRPKGNDRNSWICWNIRKSCLQLLPKSSMDKN